ncbi:MAG: sigma-70 family RNA polymerase sigma factor [Clostridia bacterium]|nr:sigma-70 family RNA polymerase sigma factor [Clostridia bacterium]
MDDKKIIKLFWDRNEQAISETDNKYGRYCRTVAINILGNTEDASECVNDTYLKTWNSLPPHRPERLSVFLGKIVRNLSFDRYSYNTAQKRGGSQTEAVLDELEECIPAGNTEDECDERMLTSELNSFLGELKKRERDVFVSRYWYAERISDIALGMNMTENSVSVMLNRTRKKLCVYLAKRGYNC